MARRSQRAFVESGQVRAGDARGTKRSSGLAGRFLQLARRPELLDAVPRPIGEETRRYFAGLPASAGEFRPGR